MVKINSLNILLQLLWPIILFCAFFLYLAHFIKDVLICENKIRQIFLVVPIFWISAQRLGDFWTFALHCAWSRSSMWPINGLFSGFINALLTLLCDLPWLGSGVLLIFASLQQYKLLSCRIWVMIFYSF